MKVRILKVFAHDLTRDELRAAAQAAAKTLNGRRFALPVVDAIFGQGWEILLIDDDILEVKGDFG